MFHYKVVKPTFRNNRLYAPGEFIESEKVLVSISLEPTDVPTTKAVEGRRLQIAQEKAHTPGELRKALAMANEQLLKYQLADAQAEIARREGPAKPPVAPSQAAPRRVADH